MQSVVCIEPVQGLEHTDLWNGEHAHTSLWGSLTLTLQWRHHGHLLQGTTTWTWLLYYVI